LKKKKQTRFSLAGFILSNLAGLYFSLRRLHSFAKSIEQQITSLEERILSRKMALAGASEMIGSQEAEKIACELFRRLELAAFEKEKSESHHVVLCSGDPPNVQDPMQMERQQTLPERIPLLATEFSIEHPQSGLVPDRCVHDAADVANCDESHKVVQSIRRLRRARALLMMKLETRRRLIGSLTIQEM
jgi:hypothetical protein